MTPAGFPHSDIHGSQPACGSPWLFAACHVLPRLPAPRHPPCALTALDQFPISPCPMQSGENQDRPHPAKHLKRSTSQSPELSKSNATRLGGRSPESYRRCRGRSTPPGGGERGHGKAAGTIGAELCSIPARATGVNRLRECTGAIARARPGRAARAPARRPLRATVRRHCRRMASRCPPAFAPRPRRR